MKKLMLKIVGVSVIGLFALSSCEELLPFVKGPDGNSSEVYVPGANEVTFTSEGETIVGTLFLPEDYQEGDALPVIIVSGPWTQVKEQVEATATVGY